MTAEPLAQSDVRRQRRVQAQVGGQPRRRKAFTPHQPGDHAGVVLGRLGGEAAGSNPQDMRPAGPPPQPHDQREGGGAGAPATPTGQPARSGQLAPAGAGVRTGDLPEWPIYAFFLGFPVWWVLGMSAFALALVAAPMALLLISRGRIAAPPSFLMWLGFIGFLFAASIMIDSPARMIGYLVRAGAYIAVTIFFLYVYNSRMPTKRIILALVGYWMFVVFGGYLGVLFPGGSVTTPVEKILPGSIASNDYVQSLVHPNFAEVQQPFGSTVAFTRPSAPLPFTNGWGCNFALLIPYVFAAFALLRSHAQRIGLGIVLAASIVPAFATLNRGLFLALGIGLSYAAIRLALRGHVRPLLALAGVTIAGIFAAWSTGLYARITARTTASSTTSDRLALYDETVRRTLDSPLLGYGAPRPSETLQVSVGTQGHVWNIMFSYGFPALLLFVGFIWWTVWRSRRAPDSVSLWLHVCILMAGVAISYYGFDGPQLAILLVTAALLLRKLEPPPSAPLDAGSPGVVASRARAASRDPRSMHRPADAPSSPSSRPSRPRAFTPSLAPGGRQVPTTGS